MTRCESKWVLYFSSEEHMSVCIYGDAAQYAEKCIFLLIKLGKGVNRAGVDKVLDSQS